MAVERSDESGSRFATYIEELVSAVGQNDRAGPLRDYCTGLLMPCERRLPGRRLAVACQCSCQPAGGLSAVPAAGMER